MSNVTYVCTGICVPRTYVRLDMCNMSHLYVYASLESCPLRFFDISGFAKKTKKIHTVSQKPRNVTKFRITTLWHLEISQNFTKCHKMSQNVTKCHKMSHFFKSLVQSYVYLLCVDAARNDSHLTTLIRSERLSFDLMRVSLTTLIWRLSSDR